MKMVKEKSEEVKETKNCDCKDCNKKGLIVGIIILVAIAVVILIIALCGGKKTNEEELKANLEKLGGQFYEKFYYPAQEKSQKDVKDFISKFEKTGIKVNLENIAKISVIDKELVEGMVNSKTNEECDKINSYAVIKPKSPYGKKDYTVEVTLACGFEEESKDSKETKKTETTKKETTKKEDTTKKTETTKKETTKTETKKTSKK